MKFTHNEGENLIQHTMSPLDIILPGGNGHIEGDWDDEDDEDFDDRLDAENDIAAAGAEDDDHLPDDDLQ
ncbi:hypothetical protein [Mucilaginibacter aquaedulcis]|uniref:hypothetical protein n=1 Tax=Mucilaginibacter aquaedulcis TaxID=1187081 RepID=UPI0025B476BE|nr:hypothetical protein [Mucilaginibacter aquaedulcis]MDN3549526.1 hypothetical protein [Mucilaginibacter aquaedulcis]